MWAVDQTLPARVWLGETRDKECVCLMVQLQFVWGWWSCNSCKFDKCTQEKSVFYEDFTVASVSFGLRRKLYTCCLVTARAFMPVSLIVIHTPLLRY